MKHDWIPGNAAIGQSGGPTAVINQSLVGVIEGLRAGLGALGVVKKTLGMKSGVRGLTKGEFHDLTDIHQDRLDLLARTPSAALASTRDKPDAAYCERILDACRKHDIRYFFYVGGNDSSDTCRIVSEMAERSGYQMACIHVPKTVDNDLEQNDHTPGFPSAARYVAMACMADFLDNVSLPGIKINVVMGRHAGFLTAASALARRRDREERSTDGPQLIYLPEVPFDIERFVGDVEAVYAKKGRCHIVVSEGISDKDHTPIGATLIKGAQVDSHGNVQLSGSGALGDLLSDLLKERLTPRGGKPPRVRADTFGYVQRCWPDPSVIDQIEARRAGRFAAQLALEGHKSGSVALVRTGKGWGGEGYAVEYKRVELSDVAARTRRMPAEFIEGTSDVSEAFLDYCAPLVGDLPSFERLLRYAVLMRSVHLALLLVAFTQTACSSAGSTSSLEPAGAAGSGGDGAGGEGSGAGGEDGAGGEGSGAGGEATGSAGQTSGSAGQTSGAGGQAAGGAPQGGGGGAGAPAQGGSPAIVCSPNSFFCEGNSERRCDENGAASEAKPCPEVCAPGIGCAMCVPGVGTCNGNSATRCRQDGMGFETEECDAALGCVDGACGSPCSVLERSYIGCDYFPTVTPNTTLFDGFGYTVVVANTSSIEANIFITRGPQPVAAGKVPANGLASFKLPWVTELKHKMFELFLSSALVPSGAYHIKTDRPVTVYQFNPLEYEVPKTPACIDTTLTGHCYSYTNDASLLLPGSALGTEYVVAGYPAVAQRNEDGTVVDIPTFLSVTATKNNTTVTVRSSANVRGGKGIQKMGPGSMQSFLLNEGDVLQLLTDAPTMADVADCVDFDQGTQVCRPSGAYDFTGTTVTSDQPIMVIGGHDCARVPYDTAACDHLEETVFPLKSWGSEVLVTAPQSVAGAAANDGSPDPQLVRIVSGADGNQITVTPDPGVPVGTLSKGQVVELPVSSADMVVKGTGPLLVQQLMAGGQLVDGANYPKSTGDPSLSFSVPSAQYRTEYTFLAPATYTYSFVNVIAPQGAQITLDGAPLPGPAPAPIAGSTYTVSRVAISGAAHKLQGNQPFGIVVYGYGIYTSYMYPGGLNLKEL